MIFLLICHVREHLVPPFYPPWGKLVIRSWARTAACSFQGGDEGRQQERKSITFSRCICLYRIHEGAPWESVFWELNPILKQHTFQWQQTETPRNYSFKPADAVAKSLQLYLTLCNLMDSSPPGSSVHRLLQAKILEWIAISFSHSNLGLTEKHNPPCWSVESDRYELGRRRNGPFYSLPPRCPHLSSGWNPYFFTQKKLPLPKIPFLFPLPFYPLL